MSIWTEDRVGRLKELWGAGRSSSDIAEILGFGITRNAVLGKMHRLGLCQPLDRANRITQRMAGRRKSKAAREKRPMREVSQAVLLPPEIKEVPPKPRTDFPPLIARVTFDELEMSHCKFPVGDPREPSFGFCGQPRVLGTPYCKDCNERARRPREIRVSRLSHAISNQSHAHKQGVSA